MQHWNACYKNKEVGEVFYGPFFEKDETELFILANPPEQRGYDEAIPICVNSPGHMDPSLVLS